MEVTEAPDPLQDIRECLRQEYLVKKKWREDQKVDRRRDSFAQICSIYAAIFIATLGVGFLTYMHDTFVDRPEGTPAKTTDRVVIMCLLLSVLLSISSSIALGAGSSPTLLLSIPSSKHETIRELLGALDAVGFPQCFTRKLLWWYDSWGHHAQNFPMYSIPAGRARQRRGWDMLRSLFISVRRWKLSTAGPKPNEFEFQFVTTMLLVALVCMAFSLFCLGTAIITFAWAELGHPVATAVSVSCIFPFAVVMLVVIVYKCTLRRRSREIKGHGTSVPVTPSPGESFTISPV
ncbi:uncharacterized protein FOMMEDRAFT_161114 [Fomitiporia mediterranea MF3/22]|uniref:uncharacterized protein n=1 Tax=Fomitiporia mediterranea (strain MF3/22) TaxID=694068 RepID=UPI00044087B9|nr:uncharacterized protein FOMMEDRAFT_161114 [Fomitiporia mediterranea MF3/22]EJC98923.1 hypothetical protein FOMMEDRAFT_161114 [Fomitiporia mediterranea MF3/22]